MTARLEDYMRVVEQRRLAQMNRGASQDTIERYTFPHKYKQVSDDSMWHSGEEFRVTNCIHITLITSIIISLLVHIEHFVHHKQTTFVVV
jgi:hypothetical protein